MQESHVKWGSKISPFGSPLRMNVSVASAVRRLPESVKLSK